MLGGTFGPDNSAKREVEKAGGKEGGGKGGRMPKAAGKKEGGGKRFVGVCLLSVLLLSRRVLLSIFIFTYTRYTSLTLQRLNCSVQVEHVVRRTNVLDYQRNYARSAFFSR